MTEHHLHKDGRQPLGLHRGRSGVTQRVKGHLQMIEAGTFEQRVKLSANEAVAMVGAAVNRWE